MCIPQHCFTCIRVNHSTRHHITSHKQVYIMILLLYFMRVSAFSYVVHTLVQWLFSLFILKKKYNFFVSKKNQYHHIHEKIIKIQSCVRASETTIVDEKWALVTGNTTTYLCMTWTRLRSSCLFMLCVRPH